MRLDALPDRLGIIGGGYIAVEMGHVFSGLGSDVTMINRSPGAAAMRRTTRSPNGSPRCSASGSICGSVTCPTKVERRGDAIVIHNAGEEIEVDELLVATGREPNSDLLDVEAGGLRLPPPRHGRGRRVPAHDASTACGRSATSRTSTSSSTSPTTRRRWRSGTSLTPTTSSAVDHKAVPAAVFSNPQVARVGLTEQHADAADRNYVVGRRDYAGTAYGWALVDETSFAKVLVDAETGLIIGAHIIGPQAATLIQPLIQAMQFDQTAERRGARAVLDPSGAHRGRRERTARRARHSSDIVARAAIGCG